ncbi:unnamed protein product [Parnassius apollo]|uniref:(apollo) hypothetical protein n=1 Tax=Parnassius apollo TaxID=110799 RepID=A0A8S3W7W0_PARAO|nr:unnamed protein product [Parnassius apollo]
MPNISWTHCFLHQQALAAKVVPSDLNDVLKEKIIEDNASYQSLVVRAYIPCMIQSLHNLVVSHKSVDLADVTTNMKECLLDLAADGILKTEFYSQSVDVFWMKRKHEYPDLAREALKLLVPFATSYLCELTYSAMVDIKTKKRNRLH